MMLELAFILPLAILAAWDVGRRFAEARSNRALLARVAALEGADLTPRIAKLDGELTALRNQIETMRSTRERAGSRWGA